jgi:hypothetical protein
MIKKLNLLENKSILPNTGHKYKGLAQKVQNKNEKMPENSKIVFISKK